MAEFYQTIKAAPMWDESRAMMLPGEIEYRTEQDRLKTGIPLQESLLAELRALGSELGVASTLTAL
ncbi:MAG: hypothetical protein KC519_22270 [Anaerolineae bacterium]|nr:hypothetical protein [Anaerolineae bacterium]